MGVAEGHVTPEIFGHQMLNSSKTVKATDFKFDAHVSWDTPYIIP